MKHRFLAFSVLVAVLVAGTSPVAASAQRGGTVTPRGPGHCGKYSGTVVLTYTNPDTIILHVIQGKVNAATTFTMTPATTYLRNGQTATFGDIKIGDAGYITAAAQMPSGTLLACSVVVTGP